MIGTIRSIHLPNDVNRMLEELRAHRRKTITELTGKEDKTSASFILTELVQKEHQEVKPPKIEKPT